VHTGRGRLADGDNWGVGASFAPAANSVTLGDWNGDGLDDLAYPGSCSSDSRPCWMVHASSGSSFEDAAGWGASPSWPVTPMAADVDGDGSDDLVYKAPCEESQCWFAQVAVDGRFGAPAALGPALESDGSGVEWIDFNGDSTADMVSWDNSTGQSWIEVRHTRDLVLGRPFPLARFDTAIEDVSLRRLDHRSTVQAVVELDCDADEGCVRRFLSASGQRIVEPEKFLEMLLHRPGAPSID
jgi:hypothetical protein